MIRMSTVSFSSSLWAGLIGRVKQASLQLNFVSVARPWFSTATSSVTPPFERIWL